ncbi:inositol monophosphatase 3-like [Mya arenaria]|uniref:inositol monophosphatase 3-like n=1 Tax=Mya arenaria TaxID=6604 RepID=UPI0022E7350E|nr:inositol monophosphatase 3-like [Mya arenaria]
MAPSNVRLNPLGGAIFISVVLLVFFYVFGFPTMFPEERVSMRELLSASIVLARRGGDRVLAIRRDDTLDTKKKGETKEGANEYVSQGDMKSHEQIYYGLKKLFPKMNVVSEEHEKKPPSFSSIPDVDLHLQEVLAGVQEDQSIPISQITVWIDPLDATQEYTEMKDKDGSDMLHYVTTMVCVAVDGQPTIGVIHKPFANDDKGETSWAWVGHGKSGNLQNGAPSSVGEKRIIVSRSHAGTVKEAAQESLSDVKITPAGGAGYKTLEVVKGNQDAYIHTTLIKKWDICAGNAIIKALNGKMTTLNGGNIDYSQGHVPKNEGGLLATLYGHDLYLNKLGKLKTQL